MSEPRDVLTTVIDIFDDSARYTSWVEMVSKVVGALSELKEMVEGGKKVALEVRVWRVGGGWGTAVDFNTMLDLNEETRETPIS